MYLFTLKLIFEIIKYKIIPIRLVNIALSNMTDKIAKKIGK